MGLTTDILKRFFSGTYSRGDFHTVNEKFAQEGGREQLKKILEQHWIEFETPETETYDADALLNNIQHRIYLEENRKTIPANRFFRTLQRIAAVLFIPLLLAFTTYLFIDTRGNEVTAYAEIRSPLSGKTQFTLPDGSTGFLNNGSSLRYPVDFKRHRTVELIGEAWFDIIPSRNTFHVQTKRLDIQVMGTTFNVMAYDNDPTEEVVLLSGKVNVLSTAGEKLAMLTPNQRLVVGNNVQKIEVQHTDASRYMSWTEGKLVFRNESMDKVVKQLCRWYNINCLIADRELYRYTFHATFMDESLDEVLKLLSLTTPMTYTEEKRHQQPDGTLVQRKIILKIDRERINQFN